MVEFNGAAVDNDGTVTSLQPNNRSTTTRAWRLNRIKCMIIEPTYNVAVTCIIQFNKKTKKRKEISKFVSFNLAYINEFHPKRGRPRTLPQMGEFDLSLISEFRNCPSFYDRSSPRFKDKIYNAHQWQEISNKLGFDVSILKDRILQLRNRYNLEKRRIEQLREENPDKYFESPWPLYEHLHFLSDHIRARRSYKKMLPLNSNQSAEFSNSCSNNSTMTHPTREGRLNAHNMGPFPNGLLTVKMEEEVSEEHETDGDTESQNNDSEGNAFEPSALISESHSSIPPQLHQQLQQQQLQLQQHSQQNLQQQQQLHHPTISIRRLDSLRQDFQDTHSSNSKKRSHHLPHNNQSHDDNESATSSAKQPRLSAREFKYAAFGNFISSSLLDLPQNTALELVEKFTSDIVKALMAKAENQNGLVNDQ